MNGGGYRCRMGFMITFSSKYFEEKELSFCSLHFCCVPVTRVLVFLVHIPSYTIQCYHLSCRAHSRPILSSPRLSHLIGPHPVLLCFKLCSSCVLRSLHVCILFSVWLKSFSTCSHLAPFNYFIFSSSVHMAKSTWRTLQWRNSLILCFMYRLTWQR